MVVAEGDTTGLYPTLIIAPERWLLVEVKVQNGPRMTAVPASTAAARLSPMATLSRYAAFTHVYTQS
jgi:hypothetical protein